MAKETGTGTGLNLFLGIIAMVFLIGVVVMVFIIGNNGFKTAMATSVSGSIDNSSFLFSGLSFQPTSIAGLNGIAFTSLVVKNSSGDAIPSSEYAVSGGSIKANSLQYFNTTDVGYNIGFQASIGVGGYWGNEFKALYNEELISIFGDTNVNIGDTCYLMDANNVPIVNGTSDGRTCIFTPPVSLTQGTLYRIYYNGHGVGSQSIYYPYHSSVSYPINLTNVQFTKPVAINPTGTVLSSDWMVDFSQITTEREGITATATANYTYKQVDAGINDVATGNVAGFKTATDFFPTFIVLGSLVVLIILTIIIINSVRNSGMIKEGGA